MLIKQDRNRLIFSIDEKKLNYDFAMLLINQLDLSSNIIGTRNNKRGQNGYEVLTRDYSPLRELIPFLAPVKVIKVVYELFLGIKGIEESNLLKRECLWCKYEYLFYDEKTESLKYIILPVSEEIEFEDNLNFTERLLESVAFMASYLPFEYEKQVVELARDYTEGKKESEEIIKNLNSMILKEDATTPPYYTNVIKRHLSLNYLEADEIKEYIMAKTEILIGKGKENVDLAFEESKAISRLHCKIIKQNENFFVQDLDSLNYTLVNGEFVPPFELMELENRDLITLGDIELRVNII